MMKQLRENTKIIIWIVVIAFVVTIFAVWGLDLQTGPGAGQQQQNLVGRINGQPISPQLYQSVYSQLAQQYRSSSPGGGLTYAQQELLREQAWENIVNNALTDAQVAELGITVSDQEILSYLREAPPAEVQQYFVDENGQFDYAAYQAALNNPEADWTAVEQLARQRIPLVKLNNYLMAQVHVGRNELQKAFEEENTRMAGQYVRFAIGGDDADAPALTDEAIQTYYESNLEEFSRGDQAVLRYVRVPIAPSDRDRDDISFTIGVIREQLENEEFAELASTYSEAPTSQVGGDTGLLLRSQRDERVMTAVDNLQPGDVSSPVWTDDGVYIVQLVETEIEGDQTRYRLNEIYLELKAGSTTTDSLRTLAESIQKSAEESGLEQAASLSSAEASITTPFEEGFPIEGMGYVPSASRFAFVSEPGAVSPVLGDETNYFVCEVVERIAAGPPALEEVSAQVERALLLDRRKESAKRTAEAFRRKRMTNPGEFVEAAEQYGYTVVQTDTFSVSDAAAGMPPRSPFAYAAFNLNPNDASRPVESFGAYYVVQVTWRSPFDQQAFLQQADALRMRLTTTKTQEYIAYWFQNLRENSDIEDYRSSF